VIRLFFLLTIICPTHVLAQQSSASTEDLLLSKTKVAIENSPAWHIVAHEGKLLSTYSFLDSLNFYSITYLSDTCIVEGFCIEPKFVTNAPVIIFNRGGNKEYARLTLKSLIFSTAKLASKGYIILASNYRDQDEFGGADVQDVLSLITLTSSLEKADTNRIGMFGWSRGGMMTYLAMKHTNRIKTAVVGNGVSDLFLSIKNRPELEEYVYGKYIPNYSEEKETELRKRSVIYWTDQLKGNTSLLLLCGTDDKRVNPIQSKQLADKLQEEGRLCELKSYKTGHSFLGFAEELNLALIDWFAKEL
jgi:dipeptidyl aminopeptidase/acylaminoacyl peptidase